MTKIGPIRDPYLVGLLETELQRVASCFAGVCTVLSKQIEQCCNCITTHGRMVMGQATNLLTERLVRTSHERAAAFDA